MATPSPSGLLLVPLVPHAPCETRAGSRWASPAQMASCHSEPSARLVLEHLCVEVGCASHRLTKTSQLIFLLASAPPSALHLSGWHHHYPPLPGDLRLSPACGSGLFPPLTWDIPSAPVSSKASSLMLAQMLYPAPCHYLATAITGLDAHSSHPHLIYSLRSSQGGDCKLPT